MDLSTLDCSSEGQQVARSTGAIPKTFTKATDTLRKKFCRTGAANEHSKKTISPIYDKWTNTRQRRNAVQYTSAESLGLHLKATEIETKIKPLALSKFPNINKSLSQDRQAAQKILQVDVNDTETASNFDFKESLFKLSPNYTNLFNRFFHKTPSLNAKKFENTDTYRFGMTQADNIKSDKDNSLFQFKDFMKAKTLNFKNFKHRLMSVKKVGGRFSMESLYRPRSQNTAPARNQPQKAFSLNSLYEKIWLNREKKNSN
jgi:hypothetical protein